MHVNTQMPDKHDDAWCDIRIYAADDRCFDFVCGERWDSADGPCWWCICNDFSHWCNIPCGTKLEWVECVRHKIYHKGWTLLCVQKHINMQQLVHETKWYRLHLLTAVPLPPDAIYLECRSPQPRWPRGYSIICGWWGFRRIAKCPPCVPVWASRIFVYAKHKHVASFPNAHIIAMRCEQTLEYHFIQYYTCNIVGYTVHMCASQSQKLSINTFANASAPWKCEQYVCVL